jgi:hypothetical protein
MHTRSKLVLATLGTTLLMALAVGTASARNLSVSNQTFRYTFNNIEQAIEGISTTTCRITLEGSLHGRTMAKVAGTLLGYITRVITGQCNPNQVTILTETLPWHLRYVGFSGRLPNITLILVRFRWASRLSVCLVSEDVEARLSRDPVTGHLVLAQIPLQLLSVTGVFCSVTHLNFRANGNGSVFQLATTTRISVTLI